MVSNKEEEARRAMDTAEKKLSENDYFEAKKLAYKAHVLYPKLDGLEQLRLMINVYISASNGGEADWYGVLGVDPLADDEALKKQFRKLALLLHPDKNRLSGAEDTFKLVLEAWSLLSDNSKRFAYDQKRKQEQVYQKEKKSRKQEPKKPHKSQPSYEWFRFESDFESKKPKYNLSSKPVKLGTFWTSCNRCKTYCEFMKDPNLNKTLTCPNCSKDFVAAEILPELINGRLVIKLSSSNHSTSKSFTSSSYAKAKATPERMLRWFEPNPPLSKNEKASMFWTVHSRCKTYCKFVRGDSLNKTLPCPNCSEDFVAAEIIPEVINGGPVIVLTPSVQPKSKRGPVVSLSPSVQSKGESTSGASSTTSASHSSKAAYTREEMMKRWFPDSREKRLFEKPMATGNANSTFEAERLFKNHMTDVK
ncbi:Chaperone protein dnaJ 49 [Cardamine amara subsp. amara]|uniref:Chaperone protein dnaJ 49 n=1 Tax=Cardamine amara subsp. amara TaxID=228776 RepID=A0ABD1AUD5_CARAN